MTPAELSALVLGAVRRAVDGGELSVEVPASVTVERPKQRGHGDYATNVALQLAKPAGRPPRDVATLLARHIEAFDGVASVDVAGPGFLNITLADDALGRLAGTIVEAGEAYGRSDAGRKRKVNLEFVSANPTGPMHVGHARWAACGDALARLLEATGHDVTREFYVNDAGAQTDKLAFSLYVRARQSRGEDVAFPEDGYHGDYVTETAVALLAERPDVLDLPEPEALAWLKERGLAVLLGEIQESLRRFGVEFDVWFSERSLHDSGEIAKAVERFREQGRVFEDGGAVWLRTTDFGDDKDRVLIRSDGTPTYFAADCAYYLDKRERGAEKIVIQVGADHHGYTGRMKAMVACYGDDPDRDFHLLIGQMVNVVRDGVQVKMSKRAGTYVDFDGVVEAVGVDAARYSLVRSSMDSDLTLDVDLVTRHDPENPVFYVQYAHARIASLLRNARDLGVERGDTYDAALLTHEREGDLLRALGEFPRIVMSATDLDAPHRVARYLEELAGIYHRFYDACRVLPGESGPEPETTRARLWLCEATRTVLANGLALLGVSAPDRM